MFKCPPCARMQAGRRERHCLIASSMNTWWKCFHSSIRRDFSWSTSWIRLRYTRSCSFPQIWLAGKFCDEFFAPYHFSCLGTLIKTRSSAENSIFIVYANCLRWLRQYNVTSRQVTAVSNAETEIFCHRYLKINNSAIKYYFLVKFGSSFTDIFKNMCT